MTASIPLTIGVPVSCYRQQQGRPAKQYLVEKFNRLSIFPILLQQISGELKGPVISNLIKQSSYIQNKIFLINLKILSSDEIKPNKWLDAEPLAALSRLKLKILFSKMTVSAINVVLERKTTIDHRSLNDFKLYLETQQIKLNIKIKFLNQNKGMLNLRRAGIELANNEML